MGSEEVPLVAEKAAPVRRVASESGEKVRRREFGSRD